MPRRTIRLGMQPSHFSFQDDEGPLVNGLASAAQSFFEGGQRRAELEMARDKQAQDEAQSREALERQVQRDLMGDNFRERELEQRDRQFQASSAERLAELGRRNIMDARTSERQDAQDARQVSLDALARQWHDETAERQTGLDAAAEQDRLFRWGKDTADIGMRRIAMERKVTGGLTEDQALNRAIQIAKAEAGSDDFGKAKPIDEARVQELVERIKGGAPGASPSPSTEAMGLDAKSPTAQEATQDRYVPGTEVDRGSNVIMEEIQAAPERKAIWDRLPEDRQAKYLALFNLPPTPKNERIRMAALQAFNQGR